MTRRTRCVDCLAAGSVSARAAPKPGPRCFEHWRAEKRRRAAKAHARHVEVTYELSDDEYWAIYDAQGGRCAVCRVASGKTRMLAVEHEHNKPGCEHPPDKGCRKCVRCLACTTCNRVVLGRYDVSALRRAIKVLTDPPARKILLKGRT